jgi:hypothetical protein
MIHLCRRPFPAGTADIGSFQTILEVMLSAAVVTNAAIIVFTTDVLQFQSLQLRFWVFIGFQWFIFTIQWVVSTLIPDVPADVKMQMQRMEFITEKIIYRVPDKEISAKDKHDRNSASWDMNAVVHDATPFADAGVANGADEFEVAHISSL